MTITKNTLLATYLTIICQFTDLTIGPIKLNELLIIVAMPLFMAKIIPNIKKNIYLILLFTTYLIITLLNNTQTHFQYQLIDSSPLKQPYTISLARYAELLLCLTAMVISAYVKKQINSQELLNRFLNINILIIASIIALHLVSIPLNWHIVTQENSFRLKGFFVEGGPFGLYIAALLCLNNEIKSRSINKIILLTALILSFSKSGFVLIAFYYMTLYLYNKKKNIENIFLYLFLACTFVFFTIYLFKDNLLAYYNEAINIEEQITSRENDPNLVMGRIAATHIGQSMVIQNPLLGVGLGNYSLLRNNDEYRGPFPIVVDWDLTGLGLITIIIENGIIGLLLLLYVYKITFFKNRKNYSNLYFIPLACFLFGVQIYFIYPWVIAGLALRMNNNIESKRLQLSIET